MASELILNELASDPDLVNDFIVESGEHLNAVESQLLTLDHDTANAEALHAIFRGFHTIKGLAGFLGFEAIQEVAHEVETVLDMARNGGLRLCAAHIDRILASKDYLKLWLDALQQMLAKGKAPQVPGNAELVASIRAIGADAEDAVPAGLAALGQIQEQGQEPAAEADVSAPRAEPGRTSDAAESRSVKVDTLKLDALVDMLGEMVIAQSLVEHDPEIAGDLKPGLARNLAQLARITRDIQRTAMAMRMIPIRLLFGRMTRLVRDLARKTGKQVEVQLSGDETELDRGIVENLADPVMHMVRNAVDHGIEPPEERIRAGKNPAGRILLQARHQAGHILVEVRDDGRGLDAAKIRDKARQRGCIAPDARLSDAEAFDLIFMPGFSTAEQVTSVSGRGVGMDVVKKQIQKLRGRVEVCSTPGEGAAFLLKVPLTLAIIDGLLVGVGDERYVLPIFAVREIFKPAEAMLTTVEGRHEMVLLRGAPLAVVRLHRRFGVQPRSEHLRDGLMILMEAHGKRFCLAVDELLGKQEVVIKSLGPGVRSAGIAGGAILGRGEVGLILDPEGLFGEEAA
jgi:two-component system chemotaxis sensor kinase CheA